MAELELEEPWERIKVLLDSGDRRQLQEYLDAVPGGEAARAMTFLAEEDRQRLLLLLEPEDAADFIEELADAHGADIVEDLPTEQAAAIVDEMESHHRADLLAEMDEEDAEAILQHMDPEEAADARLLLQYDENTAGGIMATEFVAFPQDTRVADVLKELQAHAEEYSDAGIQYVYVNSENGRLIGVVRLRDLVLAGPQRRLREIMISNPIYVLDSTPLNELLQLFDRYSFWVVPVTNEDGVMVGVVREADAEEAQGEEQEKVFLRYSGIIGGEELRTMPLSERAPRRLAWLSLNVVLSLVSASVVLWFEGTIARIFALVFFMPVINNLSGCSGNQAVAVSIRELTLGLIQPEDFMRVWRKEVALGLVNGLAIGGMLGVFAFAMEYLFWNDSPYFGLVIGTAFALNTLVAVSLGGLIPLVLRMLNADPALGAPPILTTLTDMFGLLFLLSIASGAMRLGWL
ncbi:MAG: magnesium transporter [Candidatus Hydrogenedentes bacterium]|nr:magnesium transporter [Candidatus Hydrogenedentota bacterium]